MHSLYSSLDFGLFSSNSTYQRITVLQNSVMLSASRWYLLLLLIKLGSADYFMQQSIKAFVEFNSIKCHTLLFSSADAFNERRVLLDFYKAAIKNNFIPTVLEMIDGKNKESNDVSSRRPCSRPLRSFVMGNFTHLADYMALEKTQENTLEDVWLLFITNNFDHEFLASQIELSIKSEMYIAKRTTSGYEFWEIYKTAKTDLARMIYYGSWNTYEGLMATQLGVVERRSDFGAAIFRVPEFEQEKFFPEDEKRKNQVLKVVWNLLEQRLNFTTKTVFIPNNSSKYQFCNNMIGIAVQMLVTKEIDVSTIRHWPMLSNTTLTKNSIPLFQDYSRVYLKKLQTLDSWFHYTYPFASEAWYSIILVNIILLMTILLMHRLSRKICLVRTRHHFSDVCFTLYQMLCQQGGELRQELSSISLIFVVIHLWMFLIRSIYSACLTSALTIHHDNVPFHSLEGLLANGQYEFGVNRYDWAFPYYYVFENSFTKKLNKGAMDKNISNLPVTNLEGLQRVCSGKKYAFLANDKVVFELQQKLPCHLYYLTEKVNQVNFDYVMSKQNEYLPFINRWLHVFKEGGLTDRLKSDLLRIVSDTKQDPNAFESPGLYDTALSPIILAGGVVLSVVILLAEIIYDRMRRNR